MQFLNPFKLSIRLFRRWTENCDSQLLSAYRQYGPAWTLIASEFPGRNRTECRRRWLTLSGVLEAERFDADRQLWLDGWERTELADGRKGWIRVPDLENLPINPFERLTASEPFTSSFQPSKWRQRAAGWTPIEFLALREGYEQYIVPLKEQNASDDDVQSAWKFIARKFRHRTAIQCRKFFEKQHVFWKAEEKLTEMTKKYSEET